MSLDDLRRLQEQEFEREQVLAGARAQRGAAARQFFIEALPMIVAEVERRTGLRKITHGWQEEDYAEASGYLNVGGVEVGIEFRATWGIRLLEVEGPHRIAFLLHWRAGEGREVFFESAVEDPVLPIVIRAGSWTGGLYTLDVRTTFFMLWRSTEDNSRIADAVIPLLDGKESVSDFNPGVFLRQPEYEGSRQCLIADAVYATPDAPEASILRRFRDKVVLQSRAGRKLFKVYLRAAPALARYVEGRPRVRRVFRALLVPFVGGARLILARRFGPG
jgi:hypothetical protein